MEIFSRKLWVRLRKDLFLTPIQRYYYNPVNNKRIASHFSPINKKINPRWKQQCKHVRFLNSSAQEVDVALIRNIGLMAHVDAGKTTTTERMLYYAGLTESIGEVDDGDTVTDYMDQERARGISITSAAITFPWKKFKINLIDTPGHIDFTMEVERTMCVLDGAVIIFDASAGVQAQTLTVWHQANRYNVPRIAYLNKMDKPKSNVDMCVSSIKKKLKVPALLLHYPVFCNNAFTGIIDLVSMQFITWDHSDSDHGKAFYVKSLLQTDDKKLWNVATAKRRQLVEAVADLDDNVAEIILDRENCDDIDTANLMAGLRRLVLQRKALLLLCGSSYKNIGVQLLMDAVVHYLPSPAERTIQNLEFYDERLCGLVFKIVFDRQRGFLTFVRLYNGFVEPGQRLYNMNQALHEKVGKLYKACANEYVEIPKATAGNIVILTGLKNSVTGETLVANLAAATKASENFNKAFGSTDELPVLGGLCVPDPVFFCSIEPSSLSHQKNLEFALECLKREDPSLRVKKDELQTILSGMGELHLDVILHRIKNEFKADANFGELQVAYKETVQNYAEESVDLKRIIADVKSRVFIKLSVQPSSKNSFKLMTTRENQENLDKIWKTHLRLIADGVKGALENGCILGFPVTNVLVGLHWFEVQPGSSATVILAAVSQCLAKVLQAANPCLMEPYMQLEIATGIHRFQDILGDLTQRRGQVLEISAFEDQKIIQAVVPLAELIGYSTNLRKISSGLATFTMEFKAYETMTQFDQQQAVKKLTGF